MEYMWGTGWSTGWSICGALGGAYMEHWGEALNERFTVWGNTEVD